MPWEPFQILTNVSQIIKNFAPTEIRGRSYRLRNFYPHNTGDTIYLKIKIVHKNTLKKKEK